MSFSLLNYDLHKIKNNILNRNKFIFFLFNHLFFYTKSNKFLKNISIKYNDNIYDYKYVDYHIDKRILDYLSTKNNSKEIIYFLNADLINFESYSLLQGGATTLITELYNIIKNNFDIFNLLLNNSLSQDLLCIDEYFNKHPELKKMFQEDYDYILKNCQIEYVLKSDYIKDMNKKSILDQLLKQFSLKELSELIFDQSEERFINTEKMFLWTFFQDTTQKHILELKKEIIKEILNQLNFDAIINYEKQFFDFNEQINIDKDLLYLMKNKIKKQIIIEPIIEKNIVIKL